MQSHSPTSPGLGHLVKKPEGMLPVTQQVKEQVGKCVPVSFKLPFPSDLWCDWKQKAEKEERQHDLVVCGTPCFPR